MSHRLHFSALILTSFLSFTPLAQAADESATFDVTLAGLRAGLLAYSANFGGGQYAAAGTVRASGLASVVVDGALDTKARGRVTGNRYRPSSYSESSLRDGKSVTISYDYAGGTPSVSRTPPRDRPPRNPISAAQLAGAVDPMTAALAILRDRPRDLACDLDLNVFVEGRRLANIRMVSPTDDGNGGLICQGEYRRVAGFSAKQLAEKPVWDFTVLYASAGDIFQVTEVQIPTTFGRIRMRRR